MIQYERRICWLEGRFGETLRTQNGGNGNPPNPDAYDCCNGPPAGRDESAEKQQTDRRLLPPPQRPFTCQCRYAGFRSVPEPFGLSEPT